MTRLGQVERAILARLALGPARTPELAKATGRNSRKVRESLGHLVAHGLVVRLGPFSVGRSGSEPARWRLRRRDTGERPNPDRDSDVLATLRRLGSATVAEIVRVSGWGSESVRRSLRTLESAVLVRRHVAAPDRAVLWSVA